jgi:hypothetical protein
MGVLYCLIPVVDIDAQAWLKDEDVLLPVVDGTNRYPAPREIREVLDALDDYQVEYASGTGEYFWDADVSWKADRHHGPWTSIRVPRWSGDEETPHEFYFSKGWEEPIVLIVERLARRCGPFVLFEDSTVVPLVVTPEMDTAAAIEEWKRRRADE